MKKKDIEPLTAWPEIDLPPWLEVDFDWPEIDLPPWPEIDFDPWPEIDFDAIGEA